MADSVFKQVIRTVVHDGDLKKLRRDTKEHSEKTQREQEQIKGGMKAVGSAAKRWIAGIAVAAFAALAAAMGAATRKAAEFTNSLAEIGTLGDGSALSMRRMRDAIIDIGGRVGGGTFQEFAKALYDIESAGFAGAAGLQVLETSARAAIGGVTDVSTAADLVTSVLNAYGLEASAAGKVSDKLFATVRAGKTTIDELASSIGKAAPVASAAGVSIDELLAGVAQLTKSGLSTSEAVTRVAGVIRALVRPTKEAADEAKRLGIGFDTNALQARGLSGVLQDVTRVTGGTSAGMAKLFTDAEALEGALILTKNAGEGFSETLSGIEGSAGAAAGAFQKMKNEAGQLSQRLQNRVNGVLIKLGEKILPLVNAGMERLLDLFEGFDSPTRRLINTLREIPGIDTELIVRLEAQEALRQARDVRKEIEAEVAGTTIKVGFELEQQRTRTGTVQGEPMFSEQLASAFKTIDLSTASVEDLEVKLKQVDEQIAATARQFAALEMSGDPIPDQLAAQSKALGEVRESLVSGVGLLKELEIAQESAGQGVEGFVKAYRDAAVEAADATKDLADAIEDLPEHPGIPMFKPGERKLETDLGFIGDLEVLDTIQDFEDLSGSIRSVENNLALLRDAYERAVGPEQRKLLELLMKQHEEYLDSLGETKEKAERAGKALSDMAASGRALLRLADALGIISSELADIASGALDALDNLSRLQDVRASRTDSGQSLGSLGGIAAQLPGAIGVIAGVATAVSGLVGVLQGNSKQRRAEREQRRREHEEEVRRLRQLAEAMKDFQRSLLESRRALFGGGRVGQEFTRAQLEQAQSSIDLIESFFDIEAQLRGEAPTEEDIRAELDLLDELGIVDFDLTDFFDTLLEKYDGNIGLALSELLFGKAGEGFDRTKDAFDGLAEIIPVAAREFGQLTDDIAGARQAYEDATRYFGKTTEEALNEWAERMGKLEGLSPEAKKRLERIKEITADDVITAEEEKELRAYAAWFAKEGVGLGPGFTEAEDREVADIILGAAEASDTGAQTSRSVQHIRQITEAQGNEIVLVLREISYYIKRLAGVGSSLDIPPVDGGSPSVDRPRPLVMALEQIASQPSLGVVTQGLRAEKVFNTSVGPIHINGPMDDGDIKELMVKVEEEIRRKNKRAF